MKILSRNFYNRNPLVVATNLLGKVLVRKYKGKNISGRIVEVEAYLAFTDEAAHSFKGKTKRNISLFGNAGFTYIHSIHMQNCIDIVTEGLDIPSSVLIRALEPIEGIDLMKKNRNRILLKDLTSGPGKLCQALAIEKSLNGTDVCNSKSEIYIIDDNFKTLKHIKGKRIGISKAKDNEFRFYVSNNPYISK